MKKQKKLIKKLSILFVMLILSVTVLSTTAASAATATIRKFNFDIPAKGALCHSKYSYKRNTDSTLDGWGLDFKFSDEGSGNSRTTFWLGIDNPDGINPMGSKKFVVTESLTAGMHSYSAYNAANREYVFLYASDNWEYNEQYTASGEWTPNCGKVPEN